MTTKSSKTIYSRLDAANATSTTGNSDVELVSLNGSPSKDGRSGAGTKNASPTTNVPWGGASALLFIVLLTVAAVGVLIASSGSRLNSWKVRNVNIQPQVWLSVLTTLMDGLTMFALGTATVRMYWKRAARGTTLRDMFDLYESQSIVGALNNLFHLRINLVAVASVFCLVSALRGPLFQRASLTLDNVTRKVHGTQTLRAAQLIPPGYIYSPNGTGTTEAYDKVYNSWVEKSPVYMNFSDGGCGDVCDGVINGYGFDVKCSNFTLPWDSSDNSTVRAQFQDAGNRIGGDVPSFNVSAYLQGYFSDNETDDMDNQAFIAAEDRGWFDVVSLFKTQPGCGGSLAISNCSLHHAVVKYDIDLRNGTISLRTPDWSDDRVLFQTPAWNEFEAFDTKDATPPWGTTAQWATLVMQRWNQEISIYDSVDDELAGSAWAGNDNSATLAKMFIQGDINNITCETTFGDPTTWVLNSLREMAFRTSITAANNATGTTLFGLPSLVEKSEPLTQNWTQNVALAGEQYVTTYSVSVPYLVCACIASLLAVVAITPLLWGGRDAPVVNSFNPLEVATAFNAPLMQDIYAEDTIEELVRKKEGLKKVRYDPMTAGAEGGRLRRRMTWDG